VSVNTAKGKHPNGAYYKTSVLTTFSREQVAKLLKLFVTLQEAAHVLENRLVPFNKNTILFAVSSLKRDCRPNLYQDYVEEEATKPSSLTTKTDERTNAH
jgi:hypothetical protein